MTDKRRDDVCGTRRPPDHNPKAWRKWDRALQRYIGSESGAQRVQSQPPFCCPVCGAVKYVRVFVRRRSGDWYQAQDAVQRCLFVATAPAHKDADVQSEEHTSELQSRQYLVCRLLLEKKNQNQE